MSEAVAVAERRRNHTLWLALAGNKTEKFEFTGRLVTPSTGDDKS